jgi:Phage integrase family/Phage integrase SAM-like domain
MKGFLEWSKAEHKEHPRTYQRYKVSSKALLVFSKFNGKPIDQISPALVEEYKTYRARGKRTKRLIKPATINRELACLKANVFPCTKGSAWLAIIKRRMDAAKGVYLFAHRKDANRPTLKVSNAHTRALKQSTVRSFRLYDLRHTWATRAAEAGMDMPTLAALLGHSKLNMVMRYAHPLEQRQVDAVKRLEEFNGIKQIKELKGEEPQKSCRLRSSPYSFPYSVQKSDHFRRLADGNYT